MNIEIWILKFESWNLNLELRSLKFDPEIWLMKFNPWNLTPKIWPMKFAAWNLTYEIWRLKFNPEIWPMKFDSWNLTLNLFSNSRINKATTVEETKTEEEVMSDYKTFCETYEKEIKKYGLFSKIEDSQQFFIQNPNLVCEHTASYLCIWSIDLCVEEKTKFLSYKNVLTKTLIFWRNLY